MIVMNISSQPMVIGKYELPIAEKVYIPDDFFREHFSDFDVLIKRGVLRIIEAPTFGYLGRPSAGKFDEGIVELDEFMSVADALDSLNSMLLSYMPKAFVQYVDTPVTNSHVAHKLGTLDVVVIAYNSEGTPIFPRIASQSENTVDLEFETPFMGKIIIIGVRSWPL